MMASATLPSQHTAETAFAVGKSSPPIAVTAAMLAGIPLEKWVAIATLAYIALQAAYLLWKWAREVRAKKGATDV